jgi:hypothetical protein
MPRYRFDQGSGCRNRVRAGPPETQRARPDGVKLAACVGIPTRKQGDLVAKFQAGECCLGSDIAAEGAEHVSQIEGCRWIIALHQHAIKPFGFVNISGLLSRLSVRKQIIGIVPTVIDRKHELAAPLP